MFTKQKRIFVFAARFQTINKFISNPTFILLKTCYINKADINYFHFLFIKKKLSLKFVKNKFKLISFRAVDRQSKDLGSNPSAVESVFFSTERFSNSLNNKFK